MPDRLRDPVTGLWVDAFFHASMVTRVAVARRALRPLGVALLGLGAEDGTLERSDATAREVAYACLRTLRECDQAFRLDDGTFALLLDDTDDRGTVLCSDRLRELLEHSTGQHVLWAGVASYPAHSLDAGRLIEAAQAALADARRWATSRIEVAIAP